jgi:hypothetical protein
MLEKLFRRKRAKRAIVTAASSFTPGRGMTFVNAFAGLDANHDVTELGLNESRLRCFLKCRDEIT